MLGSDRSCPQKTLASTASFQNIYSDFKYDLKLSKNNAILYTLKSDL